MSNVQHAVQHLVPRQDIGYRRRPVQPDSGQQPDRHQVASADDGCKANFLLLEGAYLWSLFGLDLAAVLIVVLYCRSAQAADVPAYVAKRLYSTSRHGNYRARRVTDACALLLLRCWLQAAWSVSLRVLRIAEVVNLPKLVHLWHRWRYFKRSRNCERPRIQIARGSMGSTAAEDSQPAEAEAALDVWRCFPGSCFLDLG